MNIRGSCITTLVAVGVTATAGCAGIPQPEAAPSAAEIKIYRQSELAPSQYQVIGHLWANSWRTAFSLPTYPSEESAIAKLREEAGRLGADGLINVICLDQAASSSVKSAEPAMLCYANAIRVSVAR
jgi:hypothetical protein